jgi:hypothetical protein
VDQLTKNERKILRITEEKKPKIQGCGDGWNRTKERITTLGGLQVKRLRKKRRGERQDLGLVSD